MYVIRKLRLEAKRPIDRSNIDNSVVVSERFFRVTFTCVRRGLPIAGTQVIVFYKVFSLTLRRLMSYIYGAPILDVSRSHTTTQHSR